SSPARFRAQWSSSTSFARTFTALAPPPRPPPPTQAKEDPPRLVEKEETLMFCPLPTRFDLPRPPFMPPPPPRFWRRAGGVARSWGMRRSWYCQTMATMMTVTAPTPEVFSTMTRRRRRHRS
ncbi:unnamed protein product, partial [Ectocarpus sp. 8 AP-2014]